MDEIAIFSNETNYYYKFVNTKDWPTIKISGTPMHRYTKLSPKEDTISKINEIKPVKGKVLDTCCGLGYTAIMAAKDAEVVYTFEWDDNMIYMCEQNPFSKELFKAKNIKLVREDVADGIKKFQNDFFDRIVHDPPTFKMSPELYSSRFYAELYRVLKRGGKLYHYLPAPQKTKGKNFYINAVKRLKEAGFKNVEYHPESSGAVAVK